MRANVRSSMIAVVVALALTFVMVPQATAQPQRGHSTKVVENVRERPERPPRAEPIVRRIIAMILDELGVPKP